MDKTTFYKIWEKQDLIRDDPEYYHILEKYKIFNAEFLKQLETMNADQRNAVLDYCGVLIELNLKMLEFAVQ